MSSRTETQVNTYTAGVQFAPEITALSDGGWVITWQSWGGQDGDGTGVYAQAYNADGTPQGGEVQVNTYTTANQEFPRITALSDGGWVITWRSRDQDGDNWGIYAQAYNADGTAQGGEVQVNTYTTNVQIAPQITALSDGGWVITWQSLGQDGDNYGIYAQAYNADGTAQGGEVQVNTVTTNFQERPQITALTDGGWVITWMSRDQDGDNWGIYAQAYNADGTPQGGEVQVNTYTTNSQEDPQITALSDGGWVITWESLVQDGDNFGVYAQAYNADGTPQGGEVQVNTFTTNSQGIPQDGLVNNRASITALSDGGWVITWQSLGQDGSIWGVYAQAYNADGTARGGEVQVNTFTTNDQQDPRITALSDGGWVITWQSFNQDGSSWGIYARAYNADGTPQGDEVQVNTYTTNDQQRPQIAALSDGGIVITWDSLGQDGDLTGIYSRVFAPLDPADISVAITGTQKVGETLTAELTGITIHDDTIAVTYIWSADGTVVAFGPEATFTPTAAQANAVITVAVKFDDTLFTDPPLEISPPTGPIDDGNNDPTGTIALSSSNANPLIYDVGDTITADTSAIADADGLGAFSYQWMRDGVAISGANSDSYLITAADEGYRIKLEISYTDGAGFNESLLSGPARVKGWTGEVTDGTDLDETLIGTDLNDRLNGRGGADEILGGDGRDYLIGGKGDDLVSGGWVRDRISGGAGDDTLLGGQGRDRITGGTGDDTLFGGQGRDVFQFRANDGNDLIADFEDGIDLIRIISGATDFGDLAIAQAGADVTISFGGTVVTVANMLVADFTADDFLF